MYKFIVEGSELITPTTILLTARRSEDEPRLFSYQPGQYAAIGFKKHHRPTAARCFSLASSPTRQSSIQFGIRVKGKFTRALLKLMPGDELDVRGPFGGFVFDADRDTEAVLLAGGIGISPFMSMIHYATDTRLRNPISLFYSCHSIEDVPFTAQLEQLQQSNPHFKAYFSIGKGLSVETAPTNYYPGRITSKILQQKLGSVWSEKTYFICGPAPFMNGMVSLLRENGVPRHKIMTEAFGQGASKQTGKIRSWPFNVYVLGATSLAAGSFSVMVGDLFKTIPPETLLNSSDPSRAEILTNSRQIDLDALVNDLPDVSSTAPPTHAALQAETAVPTSNSSSAPAEKTNPPPTVTQPEPTPISAPAPTPVPTPTPELTPKCITTQSGVTTCQ